MLLYMGPSSPLARRTFHVLIHPDISCANDTHLLCTVLTFVFRHENVFPYKVARNVSQAFDSWETEKGAQIS
jgi:hypothetical protein